MIYSGALLKLSLPQFNVEHKFQRKSDGVWSQLAALPIKDAENLGRDPTGLQVDILACSRLCGPMLPIWAGGLWFEACFTLL